HLPRSKKAGPGRLRPACVGEAPMDVIRLKVEPQLTRKPMAESVTGLGVQHHFRRASGAAGEIDDAGLVAARRFRIEARIGITDAGVEVHPAGTLATSDNAMVDLQPFGLGSALRISDERSRLGCLEA